MKSLLVSSPGRCGMHWLSRILCEALALAQQPTYRWRQVGKVLDGQIYLTHDPPAYWLPFIGQLSCVVIVRDPRDMVVSVAHYLNGLARGSWEAIHDFWDTEIPEGAGFQETLAALKRDGHNARWFKHYLQFQRGLPHFLVRYEDLHCHTGDTMKNLLLWLEQGAPSLAQAIDRAAFERMSGGRPRGEEDPGHFYRKGIVGDWRNYFTDEENLEFRARFSEIFQVLGYD